MKIIPGISPLGNYKINTLCFPYLFTMNT